MNLILAMLAMKHEHEETIDDLESAGVLVSIGHALTIYLVTCTHWTYPTDFK